MYQFYYTDKNSDIVKPKYNDNVLNHINIMAVRPTMWEEHCLECSAPVCYKNCVLYESRSDGRCKRFYNGQYVYKNPLGCCEEAMHIQFKKWSNMLTVIFPSMLDSEKYSKLNRKNRLIGNKLEKLTRSHLPASLKWKYIRACEYIRRNKLRKISVSEDKPDAFVFHGYSFEKETFHLIIEIFDDHKSMFKTSILLQPGENLFVIPSESLDAVCWQKNFLVKVYPENDIEAELDILWCDFVKGTMVVKEKPAPTVKCVVWDLDNTVWDGTLIETEDVNQLKVKPKVLRTMKELDERGIIQSIASKNDFEQAWGVVEKLGISEYILYPQIHWNAKSSSIRQIAKNLNIGIDTFALIDDSVFERNQVADALPQVRTYDISDIIDLLSKPEFDVAITEDGKQRRLMYKSEEKRNNLMAKENLDTIQFIEKSNLTIRIFSPSNKEEIERCYELVVRTNQLNMSGKKYTAEEFDEVLKKDEHINFAFSCVDIFGEYGIVGYGQHKVSGDNLIFTEFAMSCRVAGKYVESALFNYLLESNQCIRGIFKVNKTKKNILLRRTLSEIGFSITEENAEKIEYSFDNNLVNKNIVKVKC